MIKDYTGLMFDRLKVISYSHNKNNQRYWLCVCSCGTELTVSSSKLKHQKSCGCIGREKCSIRMKTLKSGQKEYGVAAKNYCYHIYKKGARNRQIEFDLTFNQFIDIVQKSCTYCGRKDTRQVTHNNRGNLFYGSFSCTGIDRLDNSKGYTLNNSVPCCWTCNNAKKDMSYDEFKEWIIQVYEEITA